ncbi:unnamed protein product [Brassica rapa subsp. trilocularis]
MTTNKFSSLLLFSLMVSTLILLPMASGKIRVCPERRPPCKASKACIQNCKNFGYRTGGCEEIYADVYCCCVDKLKSQDNPHSPSAFSTN